MTLYRRPESVLVVVYSDDGQALLLRRKQPLDFWQSVTGTLKEGESHADAARRELREETGLGDVGELSFVGVTRRFTIDPRWQHRYPPGVTENDEFEWRFRVPAPVDVEISTDEHSEYRWVAIEDAVREVWSWTNREALESL